MTENASAADTVARLRRTFRSGRTRPYAWRRRQLLALGEMMERRRDDLVQAMRDGPGHCRLRWRGEFEPQPGIDPEEIENSLAGSYARMSQGLEAFVNATA